MTKVAVTETYLTNIANAIRGKNGSSDTYTPAEMATAITNIPSGEPTLQSKTKTYTPTTSKQTETVTADSNYDGLSQVSITVNAMPNGTAGTPTASKGTVSNHAVTVTPSVTNSTG